MRDTDLTKNEVIAGYIAHQLHDGEWVEVGANLSVPRAGVLLAHLMHGPNMTVMVGMMKVNVADEPAIEEFEFITDFRAERWAEAYYPHDQLLSSMKFRRNGVFFCGGLQFDRYGNTNLFGIKDDPRDPAWRFRGPGGIGTCNATVYNGRYYLYATKHDRRTFVPKVSLVTAFGWGSEDGDGRQKWKLPGRPEQCISPLAIMDFEPASKRMRLKSVHPGVSVEEVLDNTGFDLIVPERLPVTEGPTPEEVQTLRTRIDRAGVLRRG